MKKNIFVFIGLGIVFIMSLIMIYGLRNANPYTLQLNEKDMDYRNVEYENLYQVAYGEILNILNINTNIDRENCNVYEVCVPSNLADKFYVGQYIENNSNDIFKNEDLLGTNIRIIAIEDDYDQKKITYISSGKVLISITLDEKYTNKITGKSSFEVVIGDQEFMYEVKAIGKEIKNSQVDIVLEIIDDEAEIRPGMSADVEILIEKKENVLCVPVSCVNTNDIGQNFVLQKHNNEYEMKCVELGIVEGERVEVSGDIKEGDIIVDNE